MPQAEIISGTRGREEYFDVQVLAFGGVDGVMERWREIMPRWCDALGDLELSPWMMELTWKSLLPGGWC